MQVEIPSLLDLPHSHSIKRDRLRAEALAKSVVGHKSLTHRKDHAGKSQLLFEFPTLESSMLPALQNNSALEITKRSTSVENPQKKQRVQITRNIKDFEPAGRATTRLRPRVDLEPLALKSFRNSSKTNYASVAPNSSYREKSSDDGCNFESSRGKPETHRSVPKRPSSRGLNFHKDELLKIEKLSVRENKDLEKKNPLQLGLPTIKKELTPHDLAFAPQVKPAILKQHALSVAQGVSYAIKQVKPLALSHLRSRQIMLKALEEPCKKTLLLDLDETLINARISDFSQERYSIVEVNDCAVKVRIRPHAEEFLEKMSREFEVVVFTAAEKNYADAMVKLLDPDRKYITHTLNRDNCLKTVKGLFIKDLRIIKNRDLKDMMIVDNFTPSFCFQLDNGIPIISWNGDGKDQELKYLMNYLLEAKRQDDVRIFNQNKLRLRELANVSPRKFAGLQN